MAQRWTAATRKAVLIFARLDGYKLLDSWLNNFFASENVQVGPFDDDNRSLKCADHARMVVFDVGH